MSEADAVKLSSEIDRQHWMNFFAHILRHHCKQQALRIEHATPDTLIVWGDYSVTKFDKYFMHGF